MSDYTNLITASELKQIRMQMGQTPRSMAKLLGVRLPRYYQLERGGQLSMVSSLAVRFLLSQDIPEDTPLIRRRSRVTRDRLPEGARLGRLVVLRILAPGHGMNLKVVVQCDCGVVKTWQPCMLNTYRQCSKSCTLAGEPLPQDFLPTPTPTPVVEGDTAPAPPPPPPPRRRLRETAGRPRATAPYVLPPPPDIDPDAPDLDAPHIEWLKYHDRKEREAEAATANDDDEMEMEAGL